MLKWESKYSKFSKISKKDWKSLTSAFKKRAHYGLKPSGLVGHTFWPLFAWIFSYKNIPDFLDKTV